MNNQNIVSYQFLKKKPVLLIFGLSIGVLQVLFFSIYRAENNFLKEAFSDVNLFFNRIIIDRILIESLAILILVLLFIGFHKLLNFERPQNTKTLIFYNLKCLPIILLSLLIYTPIGIFLRYLCRHSFVLDDGIFHHFFVNIQNIYFLTLIPYLVLSYVLINLNLYFQKRQENFNTANFKENEALENTESKSLEVINENGNTFIPISDIMWIEKNARVYEVKTKQKIYFIRKTISELETLLLSFDFLRINRSVLANKKYIHNYSFWEFDKFILRMNDEQKTEFIVSRERIKLLKEKL